MQGPFCVGDFGGVWNLAFGDWRVVGSYEGGDYRPAIRIFRGD